MRSVPEKIGASANSEIVSAIDVEQEVRIRQPKAEDE
jgi:hypothetical protein